MRQTTLEKLNNVKKTWYIVDAERKNLGRLATKVATVLKGKHKPTDIPNVDCGDCVIEINATKVAYNGNQETKKMYYYHSMYPSGLKARTIGTMKRKHSVELVEKAICGMLPHGKLGDCMRTHLYVYADDKHNHAAQKPI